MMKISEHYMNQGHDEEQYDDLIDMVKISMKM